MQVGPTVRLVKGLFNESLPKHLLHQRSFGGDMPVSYLHIDCDLYSGEGCHISTWSRSCRLMGSRCAAQP